MKTLAVSLLATLLAGAPLPAADWTIDGADGWTQNIKSAEGATVAEGSVSPKAKTATIATKVHTSDKKRTAKSLVVTQSAIWQNWNPIENLGPVNLADAPVLLTVGPDNYWMFGRYGSWQARRKKGENRKPLPSFEPEETTLDGFDIPLQTTRFPNQFNAPGGLKPGTGGYHAWQSRDMKNWVHHGPVTEGFSKWVTSAEWVAGKALIYYDFPNDQDPHVYVDDDLFDGEPGKNMGIAVRDPSHGSDAGFIRDLDGNMHVIIEDWSPIDASKRSWDSPLAGHAVSPNGIDGFQFRNPPVDDRTQPTGKIATYKHPHWVKEDPQNYKTNVAEYEVHEPEQEAYGDWAAICIGGQYYLFGDYDPAGGHQMSVGWFTSSSIDESSSRGATTSGMGIPIRILRSPRSNSTSRPSKRPTSSVPARGSNLSRPESESIPTRIARSTSGPIGRSSKRATTTYPASRSKSRERRPIWISHTYLPAMASKSNCA